VQLHYQHANKQQGELLPGTDETIRIFHDQTYNLSPDKLPRGRIEELLVADPDQELTGKPRCGRVLEKRARTGTSRS